MLLGLRFRPRWLRSRANSLGVRVENAGSFLDSERCGL